MLSRLNQNSPIQEKEPRKTKNCIKRFLFPKKSAIPAKIGEISEIITNAKAVKKLIIAVFFI